MTHNTQHTPGPWIARNIAGRKYVMARNPHYTDGRHMLTVCCLTEKRGMDWQAKDEKEANARLIAASPCLLEALQFIADDIAEGVKAKGSWERIARAAIAKATK